MIAHNEENKIGRALESVRFADEIIVVDCESNDRTDEIARSYNVQTYLRPNLSNLNVNKNFSFEQAHCDFIFCLDPDEVVPPACADEIRRVIAKDSKAQGYFLPRRNYYFGQWLQHGGHYPDWQLRLFQRGKGQYPEQHVHERLSIDGAVGRLKEPFYHYPYTDVEEAERKLDFYTTFEAKHLFNQGARPSAVRAFQNLYWRPLRRFVTRYLIKRGFLDGQPGYEAIRMDMRNFRVRYRKLREMTRNVP
jgi:glycosyltransferase involved in cell wall biosynthesis